MEKSLFQKNSENRAIFPKSFLIFWKNARISRKKCNLRALSRVAKAYSEMPATPHVPPADHIAVPLPPSPLPSSSLSLSISARTRGGAGRQGQGQGGRGGAQDAFADTLCYYFNTIIRKVQARPRQPPPRPHPLRPPQLSCMLLLLRPSHLRSRFGSSRIRFLCAVVGG